uniref:Uncharacterized protein n=1 Tax=Solanum lycopersicum TaxID=4081 RepID=K4CTA6_SOLLC
MICGSNLASSVVNSSLVLNTFLESKVAFPTGQPLGYYGSWFWIRDMQKDISPISLKVLTSCRTTVGLCLSSYRYSIEISTLLSLSGACYKVHSLLMSSQSPQWERLKAAACKPHRLHRLPLAFLIGMDKSSASILI